MIKWWRDKRQVEVTLTVQTVGTRGVGEGRRASTLFLSISRSEFLGFTDRDRRLSLPSFFSWIHPYRDNDPSVREDRRGGGKGWLYALHFPIFVSFEIARTAIRYDC